MKGASSEFDRLLEESFKKRKAIQPGSRFSAKITSVKSDYIFLRTLESSIPGYIPREEWLDETPPKSGETIYVYYLRENSGEYEFTSCLAGDSLTEDNLQLAYASEIPVLVQVVAQNNAGFEIKLGSFSGFLPASQIDAQTKSQTLMGKRLQCLLTEFSKSKIVVSQKKLSDRTREAAKVLLREELKPGMFVSGQIKSIHKFGLIVGIGGLDALVPASEASFKKNVDLEKEFKVGETVRAKILTVDWNADKVSLTIKDFLNDPWVGKLPFREGDILTGTIDSIKPFGLFVKLGENFSGLVPNKESGVSNRTPLNTVFQPGQSVDVFVLEINLEKRQIGLSLAKATEAKDRMDYQEYLSQETDTPAVSSFGLLLKQSLDKQKKK